MSRARPGWGSAAAFAGALGALLLIAYLVHPLVHGYRLPIGPDAPVYAWWARFGEVAGLDAIRRPGVPGAMLALGSMLGTGPLATAALLGPLLAAALGLASAAAAETALGPDPWRSVLAGFLTGAFAAALAPGWLANLAMAALFAGAFAALVLAERSWRPASLAAGLLTAAALAHWAFALIGAGILLGAAALLLPDARRLVRAGAPAMRTPSARIATAALAGTAVGAAGLIPVWTGQRPPGDTSQDQFLRRAGEEFRGFLRTRFRERLGGDLRRYGTAMAGTVALATLPRAPEEKRGPSDGPSQGSGGRRYLRAVGASWATATVGGITFLAITGAGPGGRLLAFAFFLPFAAALGLRRSLARGPRRAVFWLALALAAVTLAGSLWSWYRQRPYVHEWELGVIHSLAAATNGLPGGTPIVVAVDTNEQAPAFHLIRFGNALRVGLPPDRVDDLRLVVGRPADVLARRPTHNGDPEYDRLSDLYLEEAAPVLDRAVVVVLQPFAGGRYGEARELGRPVASGVVQLAGPPLGSASSPPGRPGLSGPALAVLCALALLLLAALGGGWAGWGLPGGSRLAVVLLAPSAGLGVAVVGAHAASLLGITAGAGGAAASGLIGLAGYLAAHRARQRPVEAAQEG